MSKNNKKHKFVHTDPEGIKEPEIKKSKKLKKENRESFSENVSKDLRKSIITIGAFITFLIIFYVLNLQYNFLDQLKTII